MLALYQSSDAKADERFRVIAVDDDPRQLATLERMLRGRPFELLPFTSPEPALASLAERRAQVDLVLLDRHMPEVDGLEVLVRARAIAPEIPCIVLTGDARPTTARAALEAGAFHFLAKPIIDVESAVLTLIRGCNFARLERKNQVLEHELLAGDPFEQMIGGSPAMRQVFGAIAKVAETDFGVLISGESGTGKELVARAIHARSPRARKPFVALNCGAIPENLIDSELFGHVRGAFTGATDARPGVFLEADGGTLFLDEVGEIPLAVQARLLRALQEREVRPIGGTGTRPVDVRVIAATHVDLEERVAREAFRADLYYRLNVVPMELPPLRSRLEDIPPLAAHLLEKHAAVMRRPIPRISAAAAAALGRHDWPGNVRELENVVLRALALSRGESIDVDALPASVLTPGARPPPEPAAAAPADPVAWSDGMSFRDARKQALDRFERAFFQRTLERCDGNLSEAARAAGLDRSNLRRTLARLGLRRDDGE